MELMGYRIDRDVGDIVRPNSLIADVAIWLAKVADNDRLLIVVAGIGRVAVHLPEKVRT
jgi:hypothetical protein